MFSTRQHSTAATRRIGKSKINFSSGEFIAQGAMLRMVVSLAPLFINLTGCGKMDSAT
jgi:hypothetical protein